MKFKKAMPLLISIATLGALTPAIVSCSSTQDVKKPTIKVEATEHGKISLKTSNGNLDLNNLILKTEVLIEVTPEAGFELDTLLVNDVNVKESKKFIIEEVKEYVIKATFKKVNVPIKEYAKIEISNAQFGSVTLKDSTLDLTKIELGTKIEVQVASEKGYELATLKVNDLDISKTFSFVADKPITYVIKAAFKKVETEVAKTGSVRVLSIENGSVSIKNTGLDLNKVPLNTKIELDVKANEGFKLKTLTVNQVNIINEKSFLVTEEKEYTINATFEKVEAPIVKTTNVTISESTNGTISVKNQSIDLNKVLLGTKIELEVTPSEGYKLSTLTVNDLDILNTLSFDVIEEVEYIVKATFTLIETEPTQQEVFSIDVINNVSSSTNVKPTLNDFKTTGINIKTVTGNGLFGGDDFGIKFASGKNEGVLTFEFDKVYKASKIELIGTTYDANAEVAISFGNANVTKVFTESTLFDFSAAEEGTKLQIKASKKNRFYLKGIKIYSSSNGGSVTPNPEVKPDSEIKEEGTVKIIKTGNGAVTVDKEKGLKGDKVKATITPDEGWFTASVYINNEYISFGHDSIYEFTLVKDENVLNVVFKEKTTGTTGKYDKLYANSKIKPSRGSQGDIDAYYEPVRGLKGPALKEALHNIIKGHKDFNYSSTQEFYKTIDVDPDNPNNMIFIYEGSIKIGTSYNKEHTWAKSHGGFGTSRPAGSDLNNLRPCDSALNSNRGNLGFKEIPNGQQALNTSSYYRPTMEGNLRDGNHFEPKNDFKGDVARIIFYMATRYEGGGEPDLEVGSENESTAGIDSTKYYTFGQATGIHGCFDDLYKWALSGIDPVSDYEVNRNNIVDDSYQHNRNPFIDHPEFIQMIYDKKYDGPGALEDK